MLLLAPPFGIDRSHPWFDLRSTLGRPRERVCHWIQVLDSDLDAFSQYPSAVASQHQSLNSLQKPEGWHEGSSRTTTCCLSHTRKWPFRSLMCRDLSHRWYHSEFSRCYPRLRASTTLFGHSLHRSAGLRWNRHRSGSHFLQLTLCFCCPCFSSASSRLALALLSVAGG